MGSFNLFLLFFGVFVAPILIGKLSRMAAFIYAQCWIAYALMLLSKETDSFIYMLLTFIGLEIFIPIGNQFLDVLE